MKRAVVALFATLAFLFCAPPHAFAAALDHFAGTSAPSGWTFVNSGNGGSCMNGTIVAGSGFSCTGATSGEDWLELKTTANADAAMAYRTTAVDFNTSRIYHFKVRNSTTSSSYIFLNEGVPAPNVNTSFFGTSGKVLMRVTLGANSGVNVVVERYSNDASRTRTSWNAGTNTWDTPAAGVNASTITTGTYSDIRLEIDGPNRRWRVHVIGQTGTSNTPSASMHQVALTDWVNFSFHEGGSIFCNPTCGTTYLTVGEPLTDAATSTELIELYEEFDGTRVPMWTNGRNAGGTWSIFKNHGYPDANGIPRFVPFDRSTTAITVGGAGAWDEQHVKDPFVLLDGATYHMCFSGARVSDGKFQIGFASASSEDGPWTKNANNPIVPLSGGTTRDQTSNCSIIKDEAEPDANKRWKVLFTGIDTSSPIRFRGYVITCAQPPTHTSCDTAAEWSAPTLIADVGGVGEIDEVGWNRMRPMRLNGVNYVFGGVRSLSGGVAQNQQEVYATTSDRWLGPVTKTGLVSNGSASSNCNTTTTAAITTTGSRTFTVASTTGCNRDDMVVVDDDATTGNYHVNRILRVASATSLIMYHNEDALASGARVRSPNAFWRVDAGPTLRIGATYAKFATCFDPMAGGGSTFDAYAEQTCTWTSSSPTGPWTLYGLGTPTVPLNSFGRGASNENPAFATLPISALAGGGAGVQGAPPTIIRTFPKSF